MSDELIPTGDAYAYSLLEKWGELILLSEQFMQNVIAKRMDTTLQIEYVAKLMRFWMEVNASLESHKDKFDASFLKDYRDKEKFFLEPAKLLEPDNIDQIPKIEMLIRMALEKLGISQFKNE